MPRVSHPLPLPDPETLQLVKVKKGNQDQNAYVIERGAGRVYVHYANTDRRLDEWVPERLTEVLEDQTQEIEEVMTMRRGQKRKRTPQDVNGIVDGEGHDYGMDPLELAVQGGAGNTSDEEGFAEHQMLTARRNFDMVNFGEWQMKTWYFSPYPITESESEDLLAFASTNGVRPSMNSRAQSSSVVPTEQSTTTPVDGTASTSPSKNRKNPSKGGVHRTTARSHGRTADMLAGGLTRDNARQKGEANVLWVCDRCFKYMNEGLPYEIHTKTCDMQHPPGRVVYQNGAYHIYEVDGAEQKLYCQNLSLFGKLFIDIKTLFFDCENFLFYILTDAKPSRDHVIGFFSKEKVSFDGYNLACIVILPPYQRKGHGMSLIEFSYVLSRRAGTIGTPERPLSDLGLRSYLSYWVGALIRFFRTVIQVLPAELPGSTRDSVIVVGNESNRNRKRQSLAPSELDAASSFGSAREMRTSINADGSATTHVHIKCTLEDISAATSIRPEDVAFALREIGFISRKDALRKDGDAEDAYSQSDPIIITRAMVEKMAEDRNVKNNIILSQNLRF